MSDKEIERINHEFLTAKGLKGKSVFGKDEHDLSPEWIAMEWLAERALRLAEIVVEQAAEIERLTSELANKKHCPGIPHPDCDYLATCNALCNKCGQIAKPLLILNELSRLRALVDERGRRLKLLQNHMLQSEDPLYTQHSLWFIFCRDHCNEAAEWFDPETGECR